ncbi:MAG TPA: magnesium chelatase, partial [Clostridiales bacterium]|nr:magnesium chelatase [Clostridiales bacterium]
MRLSPTLVRHDGNAALLRAVEMSVLSTLAGWPLHLHAEGLRGTGKTTIIRATRPALPQIERVKGCLYNCDPRRPHCPDHLGGWEGESEWVPMPFIEISHSAKVGTVVGSVDLAGLTDARNPRAALLPGSIPQANRGIIFVDEINRLADTAPELADVLLDVMGTKPGRIQVEETGLPRVEVPLTISVWAASNPDEDPGPLEDIRKQLSDRFDFVIAMSRPSRPEVVAEILAGRAEAVTRPPALAADAACWQGLLANLARVVLPRPLQRLLAGLYVDFNLESLRAVEAIQLGARVHAALEARAEVTLADVLAVTAIALRHRADLATVTEAMKHLEEWSNQADHGLPPGDEGPNEPMVTSPPSGKQRAAGALSGSGVVRNWGNLLSRLWPGPEKGAGLTSGDRRSRSGQSGGLGRAGRSSARSCSGPEGGDGG